MEENDVHVSGHLNIYGFFGQALQSTGRKSKIKILSIYKVKETTE